MFVEIVIAVALVTGGIAYLASHPKGGLNWGYITLAGNTAVVFGLPISWFRQAWIGLVFWAVLAVSLLGHVAVYVFVLVRIHDFPTAYYIILNSMELAFHSYLF